MEYIITMKRMIFKHLLRAKYMVDGKFFWNLNNAIAQCEKTFGKNVVWTIDHKQAYVQQGAWSHVHEDAKNFSTNI